MYLDLLINDVQQNFQRTSLKKQFYNEFYSLKKCAYNLLKFDIPRYLPTDKLNKLVSISKFFDCYI